ncbi:hypothetical protein GALMADRAFT_213523 [Galerina marginata CBS 339.88]|uniref:Uncharacterized protein n=1 Tax=Galerina marginata (strain CBS 339.88) TaxID=685588 RepID=A0A067SMC1_GALM3|nr:hypothetical protein GALMADRAFT_213523 [Galerina marginata CBS 339.88]
MQDRNRFPQKSSLPVSLRATPSSAQDGRDPVVDGADAAGSDHAHGDGNADVGANTGANDFLDLDGSLSDPNISYVVAPHPDNLVEHEKLPHQTKWHVVTIGYPCGIHQIWGNASAAAAYRGGTVQSFPQFSNARNYYRACYKQGNCRVSDPNDSRRCNSKKNKAYGSSGHPIRIASSPIYVSSTPVSPADGSGTSGLYLPVTPTRHRNAAAPLATSSQFPINLRLITSHTTVSDMPRFSDPRAIVTATTGTAATTHDHSPINLITRTTALGPSSMPSFSDSRAAAPATTGPVPGAHTGTLVQNLPYPHPSTPVTASTHAPATRTVQKKSKKRYVTVSDSSSDQLSWTRKKNSSSAATRVKKPKNTAQIHSAPSVSSAMQAAQGAQPSTQLAVIASSAQLTQAVQVAQLPAPPVAVAQVAQPVQSNAAAGPSNATRGSARFPYVIDVSDFEDEPAPFIPTKRRGGKKRLAPKTCVDSDGYEYTEFDGEGWEEVYKILDSAKAPKDASRSM